MIMCVLVHRFGMVDHAADTMPTAGVGGRIGCPSKERDEPFATDHSKTPSDFFIALGWSGGIGFGFGRVGRVPVQHPLGDIRSEERRVGKECRARVSW